MSLIELLGLMRKYLKLVIILPLVCAAATAAFAWLVLPNTYTASVSMYVLTSTSTENVGGLTNTELSASQMLTNDVAALIKSDRVERDTAESLSMKLAFRVFGARGQSDHHARGHAFRDGRLAAGGGHRGERPCKDYRRRGQGGHGRGKRERYRQGL